MQLPVAVAQFLESGVSMSLGTADRSLQPEVVRALGARVSADFESLTAFVPEALARRMLENLQTVPRVALTASRVVDHRTLQVKGSCIQFRPAVEAEQALIRDYMTAFSEQLYLIGLPRTLSARARWWPAIAVEFTVDSLFEQTPGPGTGGLLSGEEASRAVR